MSTNAGNLKHAYLYNMPVGYAGNISRAFGQETVETYVSGNTLKYGDVVALSDGKVVASPTNPIGFVVRPFPTALDNEGTIAVGENVSILRRGYITVKLEGNTASALNGAVYVSPAGKITAEAKTIVGNDDATAEPAESDDITNALLSGAKFNTSGQAGDIVEIAFNI